MDVSFALAFTVAAASFFSTVLGAGAVYSAIRKDIFYLRRDVDSLMQKRDN